MDSSQLQPQLSLQSIRSKIISSFNVSLKYEVWPLSLINWYVIFVPFAAFACPKSNPSSAVVKFEDSRGMSSHLKEAVASVIFGKENTRPVAAPVRTGMRHAPKKLLGTGHIRGLRVYKKNSCCFSKM